MWRYHPNPVTFNPLLVALGRAVLRMPVLAKLHLTMEDGIIVEFLAPGEPAFAWHELQVEFDRSHMNRKRWYVWKKEIRRFDSILGDHVQEERVWDMPSDVRTIFAEKVGADGLVATGHMGGVRGDGPPCLQVDVESPGTRHYVEMWA